MSSSSRRMGGDFDLVQSPPEPPRKLTDYTAERVRESLKYADSTLRHRERKMSPAGGIALQLYKDNCTDLLGTLDIEERKIFGIKKGKKRKAVEDSHRAFIREAEIAMQFNACMQLPRTNSGQELQEEIFNLLRFAFYRGYGDYFAEICKDLNVLEERGTMDGWQPLSKAYWSDIAKKVKTERPVYERFLKGIRGLQAQMPTTHTIQITCLSLGLYPDDILQIIQQYSISNDLPHANFLPMIKGGLFMDLAKRLCLDRIDLPFAYSGIR